MTPIFKYFRGRGISVTEYMDNFTNQAICRCKAIFQIHVIALVFMTCSWSINWVKTILEPTRIPLHLGFLWDTMGKTITLPEDKTTRVEAQSQKLLIVDTSAQESLECFMGTLISTTLAVWQGPLHYRAFQTTLIISLKHGRNNRKSVKIFHPLIRRDLHWWASGGLRANRTRPWYSPKPTL